MLLRLGISASNALRFHSLELIARWHLGRSKSVQNSSYFNRPGQLAILSGAALALAGCLSGGSDSGGISSQPLPQPVQNTPPVISGAPAGAVIVDDLYSFTPSASDADGDALTFTIDNPPSWAQFSSSTGELSGRPTLAHVGEYENIRISVSDGQAGVSLPSFSVSVQQAGAFSVTLSWVAPTENDDGSALTDLAGYNIYWGTTPGQYTNSVRIDDPGLTTYVVDNLVAGSYEFVATAVNRSGAESIFSNPATKSLQ